MYKLFDNWNDEEEVLNVPDVFGICFQDVTEELKKVLSPVSIIYKSSTVVEKIKEDEMAEIYYGRWKNRVAFGPFAFGRTGNKKLEEVEKCQKK